MCDVVFIVALESLQKKLPINVPLELENPVGRVILVLKLRVDSTLKNSLKSSILFTFNIFML